jgi:hypothetical protein
VVRIRRNKRHDQGDDDDLSDVPLEAYIHSFKVKYARQQEIFDNKSKIAQAKLKDTESENSVLTQTVQRLTAALEESQANFKQVNELTKH